jgi:tripartite ATP-independent transporter DctP family solute receptor
MPTKPRVNLLYALAVVIGLLPAPQAIADQLIKLAHPNRNDPLDNATAAMAVVFKGLVESGSAEKIKVDIYPEGQVGSDDSAVALVGKGVIQSTIAPVGGVARVYPLIGALDAPFAYPNISTTYAVFDGPFGHHLAQDIEQKTKLHVLGFGDSGGFFALTNAVRPIKSPADLVGLKIRTMPLESHKIFVASLGAEPVGIAFGELYTALASRTVDGQMNPIPIIRFGRFDEVQKYLTLTNHFFTPYVWVMNLDFWNGLTLPEQDVINNAVRSAIVAGRGLSRIIEASDRGLPALKQRMTVYLPSADEIAAFRQIAQPAFKTYVETKLGAEGVAIMDGLIESIAANKER